VADDETADASDDESADVDEAAEPDEGDGDVSAEADEVAKADEADDEGGADETDEGDESDADEGENESGADESAEDDDLDDERASASRSVPSPTPSAMRRGLTAKLSAFDRPAARPSSRFSTRRVSSTWRSFVEPGVRAYPDIEIGDAVRIDGEVESHRGDVQVESEALVLLEAGRPRPSAVDSPRRSPPRPVRRGSSRSRATRRSQSSQTGCSTPRRRSAARFSNRGDRRAPPGHRRRLRRRCRGRARLLPLIREEHAKSDAEYHYFTRRPLDDPVYGMDAATNDATRMLQDRDRHDEQLPLFLLVGTGSTTESADGIDLLSVYGVNAVVVDAEVADPETREAVDTLVSPEIDGVDADLDGRARRLAGLRGQRRSSNGPPAPARGGELLGGDPDRYVELARDAGYDAERVAELREAVALEAYYQSYQDKRELVADLLFEDSGNLAAHVSEQFREKLETEIKTATENVVTEAVDGVEFAVLDTDGYTHRYDFPPTPLLLDDLHRRNANGEAYATVGIGMDELYLRTTADVSVRDVAERTAELAPGADVTTAGLREGKIEFLSGERDAVEDAIVAAVAEAF